MKVALNLFSVARRADQKREDALLVARKGRAHLDDWQDAAALICEYKSAVDRRVAFAANVEDAMVQ